MSSCPFADLVAWIEALRARLACGELQAHPPVRAGINGPVLPAELAVRYMLADYDHYDDLTEQQRRGNPVMERRLLLMADCQHLRSQLAATLPSRADEPTPAP
jgi:hypothetical protein